MTRILTITVSLQDDELATFLARIGERGVVAGFDGDDGPEIPSSGAPGELDTNGVPWIDGIHASTKGKTNTGLWRGAKGVSADQRKAAEDAWKAQAQSFTVPQSISGVPGGVTLQTPPMTPVPPMNPAPAAMQMPGFAPPAMPGFAPVVAPVPDVPVTYVDIANKYQALLNAGRINQEAAMAMYRDLGIVDPNVLQADESLRRAVMAKLNAFG